MKSLFRFTILVFGFCLMIHSVGRAENQATGDKLQVFSVEGDVQFKAPDEDWQVAVRGQVVRYNYFIKTGEDSRTAIQWPNGSVLRLNEKTEIELRPPKTHVEKGEISILKGLLYFFSRHDPDEVNISTPAVAGGIKGTEFTVEVDSEGATRVDLIDGLVFLENGKGNLSLGSGQSADIAVAEAPVLSQPLTGNQVVQWCLYYPVVLNVDELPDLATDPALSESLNAWRLGNPVFAMNLLRDAKGEIKQSESFDIYRAALLLSCGQIDDCRKILMPLSGRSFSSQIQALELLIQVVENPGLPVERERGRTASEWLAISYALQAANNLEDALEAAERAVQLSPEFGYAFVRLAGLAYSSGDFEQAQSLLAKAGEISPDNPQTWVLRGFIALERGNKEESQRCFEQALALDASLATAWLGQGLSLHYSEDYNEALKALLAASAIEPNRGVIRSYLGKLYAANSEFEKANEELSLASRIDPNDPTPWLYQSIVSFQSNRLNTASRQIEKSIEKNDNRRIYRSKLLLDQDQSVRRNNLSGVYRDLGMKNLGEQESARSLEDDPANYAAHLFLSSSYNHLRDPKLINLRYETAWLSELLLANLLSPARTGALSTHSALQDTQTLFSSEAPRFFLGSEWYSQGEWNGRLSWSESHGPTGLSLDADYQGNDGFRRNDDFDRLSINLQLKQQIGTRDTFLVMASYNDYDAGDVRHLQDTVQERRDFRLTETQNPLLYAGWHHQWNRSAHTLALFSSLHNEQTVTDQAFPVGALSVNPFTGEYASSISVPMDIKYDNRMSATSMEVRHLQRFTEKYSMTAGLRYQRGDFTTSNRMTAVNPDHEFLFEGPVSIGAVDPFKRLSGYTYLNCSPLPELSVIMGLTRDEMTYPQNMRQIPVTGGSFEKSVTSPKLGIRWSIHPLFKLRAFYGKSLGGVSFDESVRLEPVQVAGFLQAFRSTIAETLIGTVSAPENKINGLGFDWKVDENQSISVQADQLESRVNRQIGFFTWEGTAPAGTASTREYLDYKEENFRLIYNCLIGDNWTLRAAWNHQESDLVQGLPNMAPALLPAFNRTRESTLDHLETSLRFHHASGWYGLLTGRYLDQKNIDTAPDSRDESFGQIDLVVGFRNRGRRYDVSLGLLNMTDENYALNPLNPLNELPRERTIMIKVKLNY